MRISYTWINNSVGLSTLITKMRQAGRIALDTEGNSLHHYFQKICLIQLTMDGRNYIVDPLSEIDLSEFLDVLASKPLILHGAEYDLRMLRTSLGYRARNNIFDTMLAGVILGYEQVGLAALVKRFINITLPKQGQKSDWSRRPLTQAQLEYASADTHYLATLANKLSRELHRLGRTEWHKEMCENMVRLAAVDAPSDPENEWRIKGISLLTSRQMVFARQIWLWRENEARIADIPPFKVLDNQRIIDLAIWATNHFSNPDSRMPPLPRNCIGRRLSSLYKAFAKARKLPRQKWPGPRKPRESTEPTPSVNRPEIEALRAECAHIAQRLAIVPSVLAPRAALAAVVRKRAKTIPEIMAAGPLMHWQAALIKPALDRIHKGK